MRKNVARYMADPRYSRPDGIRPRFMIYRPGDMPDPAASVAKLRDAWLNLGIGDVELGAVAFHVNDRSEVPDDLFDFWVEMPPHGMVGADAYLFGGPSGNLIGPSVSPGFEGLVYSYDRVIDASLDPARWAKLPSNTICGAMPSWDNSARRGLTAHIAHGATPARFRHWIDRLCRERVDASYRQEMFLNAWNEWAEKATLEPSITFGRGYLDAVKEIIAPMHRSEAPCDARRQRKA